MASTHDVRRREQGLGRYRGATYSRTWLTVLAGMTLAWLFMFSIAGGNSGWIALIPVTVVVIGALWLVPLTVVTTGGVRLVFKRVVVPWSDVEWVLDPRAGDEEARLQLTDGHVLTVPGVSPRAVPALRVLWSRHRR